MKQQQERCRKGGWDLPGKNEIGCLAGTEEGERKGRGSEERYAARPNRGVLRGRVELL